jgi:DNA-binding NarL/FixJ family response regulator
MLRRHDVEVAGSSPAFDSMPAVDVLLVDWELESDDGPAPADIPVLALVDAVTPDLLAGSVRGLLPKGAGEEEIVAAVEAVSAGLYAIHPAFADVFSGVRTMSPVARDRAAQILTPREIEVLRMMAEGLGNKNIAWKLGISEHTVKFHITSIFSKLNAGTRTEAVTAGIRMGLVLL